jgi:putative autotransporter adhesin-like protein
MKSLRFSTGWTTIVAAMLGGWLTASALADGNSRSGPALVGSGTVVSDPRTVSDFAEIGVTSAITLAVKIGPEASIVVTTDDNIVPHVKTEFARGRLKIYVDESYSTKTGVKVAVSVPALRALSGAGASKSTVVDVHSESFQLNLSGASECRLQVEANSLNLKLDGGSTARIAGAAKEFELVCGGASKVDAHELTANIVKAELNGASTARVNATDELDATANGASTLRYAGRPGRVERKLAGASNLIAE